MNPPAAGQKEIQPLFPRERDTLLAPGPGRRIPRARSKGPQFGPDDCVAAKSGAGGRARPGRGVPHLSPIRRGLMARAAGETAAGRVPAGFPRRTLDPGARITQTSLGGILRPTARQYRLASGQIGEGSCGGWVIRKKGDHLSDERARHPPGAVKARACS